VNEERTEKCATSGTFPWSFVTQICHNGQPSHGGDRKTFVVMTSTSRLNRRVPLVEQKRLTLLEHLSSSPVFSGVRVTLSIVLYVCFIDRCLSFCTFSFGHCAVRSSSIYGF
jgi:hypothetical protein